MAVSHTRELRKLLANTITQLQAGDISAADARAIAELSKGIIQASKLDLDVYRLSEECGPLQMEPIIGADGDSQQLLEGPKVDAMSFLRERICEALAEAGTMKPELISKKLGIPQKRVQKVLCHEWFEETTEGYRIAQS